MNASLEDRYLATATPLRHHTASWSNLAPMRGIPAREDWFAASTGTHVSVGLGQRIAFNVRQPLEPDVFGHGQSFASTQLSILDFEAEQCGYGETSDEFQFRGFGRVRSFGCGDRDVRLQGLGQVVQGTPILRSFTGQVVVDDAESRTWSAAPELYNVEGFVAAPTQPYRGKYSPPSRAYNAFKELGAWLNLSDGELAKIIEVSRTTVTNSWKGGKEPRKHAQARRLFQLHAVARALHRALGQHLVPWLERGQPAPLTLLREGHFGRFERLADEVIFPRDEQPRARLDAAGSPPTQMTVATSEEHNGPRKRSSRVRSRRLQH
jgi:hypothetical protein